MRKILNTKMRKLRSRACAGCRVPSKRAERGTEAAGPSHVQAPVLRKLQVPAEPAQLFRVLAGACARRAWPISRVTPECARGRTASWGCERGRSVQRMVAPGLGGEAPAKCLQPGSQCQGNDG